MKTASPPHVGLFVTCLVDFFRPQIALATIKLLENAGCRVSVPLQQTCCGQPAYNTGDRKNAQAMAEQVLNLFEKFDYIVVPSGSCSGMLHIHYPELFKNNTLWLNRIQRLSERTYELTAFLVDILKHEKINAVFPHKVTYHDACSGLRELKIKQQPRQLLKAVKQLKLVELPESETCCGFGGTFCVKYSEISNKMVENKIKNILRTEADTVVAGDLGCLMNIEGKIQRDRHSIKSLHIAEILVQESLNIDIGKDESSAHSV